ncbi:helix-turn-helix domain-containing protein [Pseudarthrobacter sp. NPDC058362]|uniref:helix-turn-helix domain-containing protein n=1 Tax=Pseudarthrobacter sp. NPDC058362 TaxID=3346458 RepID=UPI0036524365
MQTVKKWHLIHILSDLPLAGKAPQRGNTYDGPVPDEANQPRFLTLAQVADELNVKQSLVQRLIRTVELRAFQVGGRGMWRIGRQDVEDYITQAYQRTAERIAAGDFDDGAESEDQE